MKTDKANNGFLSGLKLIFQLSADGFSLLSSNGRRSISVYAISLSIVGLLDALGLGLLARVLSTSTNTTITASNDFVTTLFIVVVLFSIRSLLAVSISFYGLRSMAKEEVDIGQKAFRNFMSDDWMRVRSLALSDIFLKVDRAPNALVQNFLFLNATIIAELINGVIIIGLLLVVSPVTALVTGIYFGSVAVVQHLMLSRSSSRSGAVVAREFGMVYEILNEAFDFGKLQRVMPTISLQSTLHNSRTKLAQSRATAAFLSAIPRYFMEGVLAFGFLLIFTVTYYEGGADKVIPALAIFAGAGFRLLPIVNKIQGLILVLFSSQPLASSALSRTDYSSVSTNIFRPADAKLGRNIVMELQNVSLFYPDSPEPTISDVNLTFEFGKQYAIVGNSGSGKTTLTEIILGLLPPSSGRRFLSSVIAPKFGYVPQDTPILAGSIEQNIAMTWDESEIDHVLISKVIEDSQLQGITDVFDSRQQSSEKVSLMLSGGQRQRLGLARALYMQSNFLILDEPTSALDSSTEFLLVKMLAGLKTKLTTVTVAHRLTTVKHADELIYMENGRVKGVGSFESLSNSFPDFQKLVENSSLNDKSNSHD